MMMNFKIQQDCQALVKSNCWPRPMPAQRSENPANFTLMEHNCH